MRFKLPRNRTISSTCGLSIEFKKDEWHLVPPAMYADVIAAGGVSEDEIPEDEKPAVASTPEALAEREAAIFKAYTTIAKRNRRGDFTAGGMPHAAVLAQTTGWAVADKERDSTWVKFLAHKDD
jgi:hypothetical protein